MIREIDPLQMQHSDLDDSFRRHAFEVLRRGVPVAVRDVVEASPSGAGSAQTTLDKLVARGMAEVDDENLVAIDGLSVRPTGHRMTLDGYQLFTWCAADAVGIPVALGEDADVVTACPQCSSEIYIAVRRGTPEAVSDIVLWLPTSGCSHVVSEFCPDVNLFCSPRHLDEWKAVRDRGEGLVLAIDEVAALGSRWWAYLTRSEQRTVDQ